MTALDYIGDALALLLLVIIVGALWYQERS